MERPAHTALFQSIWNHPAEENGQNVNLGSWGGGSFCGLPSPLPLLVAAIIRAPANYRVVHLVIFFPGYFGFGETLLPLATKKLNKSEFFMINSFQMG